MINVNRLFAATVAIALLSAPAAAQKPTPTPRPAKPAATPAPPVLPKGIDGFEGHLKIDWSKVPRDRIASMASLQGRLVSPRIIFERFSMSNAGECSNQGDINSDSPRRYLGYRCRSI